MNSREAISELSKRIVKLLSDHIAMATNAKQVIGKGNITEVAVETPFMLYDNRRLTFRVRIENEKVILHDNGDMGEYLSAYGLDVFSKKVPAKYSRWLQELFKRNELKRNEDYKWFCSVFNADSLDGEKILRFIESIAAISFLVLPKMVGMQPLSWKDRMLYESLRSAIETRLDDSDIEITTQIDLKKLQWSNRWGMLLQKKNKISVALQFLGGDTIQKIGENIMLTYGVLTAQQNFLGLSPNDCIIIFSGSRDHYQWAQRTFNLLTGSLRTEVGYPFVMSDDVDKLINLLSEKLSLRGKSSSGLAINKEGQLEDTPDASLLLELESNNLELQRADALNNSTAFGIIHQLYELGPLPYSEIQKQFPNSFVKAIASLFTTRLICAREDELIMLTPEGEDFIKRILHKIST